MVHVRKLVYFTHLQALYVNDVFCVCGHRVFQHVRGLTQGHGLELCGVVCAVSLRNALRNTLCDILRDLRDILQRVKWLYFQLHGRNCSIFPHHTQNSND